MIGQIFFLVIPFFMLVSFQKGVHHFRKIHRQQLHQFKKEWSKNPQRGLVRTKKDVTSQMGHHRNALSPSVVNNFLGK